MAESEEELLALKRETNATVNALRARGDYAAARVLREEVLRLSALWSDKRQERLDEERRLSEDGISTSIAAEAASAVSEAERLLGG